MLTRVIAATVMVALTVPSLAADLMMRFVLDGPNTDGPSTDAPSTDGRQSDQTLKVHPENRGVANVIVMVDRRQREKLRTVDLAHRAKEVVMMARNRRYVPQVVVMRPGDTLVIKNDRRFDYAPRISFVNNSPSGALVPAKGPFRYVVRDPEPVPIPVECVYHPSMRAHVVCVDHPFVGVSDEHGALTIEGLPDDVELTFRMFHERFTGVDAVKIKGEPATWHRGRFQVSLTQGEKDLGTIAIGLPDEAESE